MRLQPIKRNVRNFLTELLLDSFNDPKKRATIKWLAEFCRIAAATGGAAVPLNLLPTPALRARGSIRRWPERLAGMDKLLQLRRRDVGEKGLGRKPRLGGEESWLVEPTPEVCPDFSQVCERVRIYAGLVSRMEEDDPRLRERGPLEEAMFQAALCFNAGLFFEAHEHLEHRWAALPKGSAKRFLQGIIQISVGFHHACAGRYDGAINLLARGLEKTSGTAGKFLGLDCDVFLPKVAATRDAIVKRGRTHMRPLTLHEIPHMPIHPRHLSNTNS